MFGGQLTKRFPYDPRGRRRRSATDAQILNPQALNPLPSRPGISANSIARRIPAGPSPSGGSSVIVGTSSARRLLALQIVLCKPFRMRTPVALCIIVVAIGIAGCDKADESAPNATAGIPGIASPERPRDVRPPPASSGMSSDPNNPSGAPGPSTGLGTSPNRY